jgi:hypothetical protein
MVSNKISNNSSRTKNRHYSSEKPIYRSRVRYFSIPNFSILLSSTRVQKCINVESINVIKNSNSEVFQATVHKPAHDPPNPCYPKFSREVGWRQTRGRPRHARACASTWRIVWLIKEREKIKSGLFIES